MRYETLKREIKKESKEEGVAYFWGEKAQANFSRSLAPTFDQLYKSYKEGLLYIDGELFVVVK